MPDRMGRLSNGVGLRHPVTTLSSSLIAMSMMQVCILGHQTGAQYSAVEYTRAICEVSFPLSDPRCQWYVNNLSSYTIRCVGIWMKDRHFPSSETLSLQPASLSFRWKAAPTLFLTN